MGVKKLWSILKELGEDGDINSLSGKRIAVDLSIWVYQALSTEGLNEGKNPHLRLLTDRVYPLLRKGILPIFVIEGKVPDLKRRNNSSIDREKWDRRLKECQKLLKSLGVPCIKASGEAEAGCAYLYLKQKVDGILTEDGDALLYGAEIVYRGLFKNKENKDHVTVYSLKSEKNKLNLDRTKLISIALLLGCDYEEGVPTIGEETVKKFLELHITEDYDIFQRFKDWSVMDVTQLFPGYSFNLKKPSHCKRCSHEGTEVKHGKHGCEVCGSKTCSSELAVPCVCAWHKSNESKYKYEYKIYKAVKEMQNEGKGNFPNLKVIDEYLNYTDELPHEDVLEWKCPNKSDFLDIASTFSQRTADSPQKDILKFMTAWQLDKLSKDPEFNQTDFLYKPVKILKLMTRKGEKYYIVQWESKDTQGQRTLEETQELVNVFKRSYPELTELFEEDKLKGKKVSKPKKKVVTKTQKRTISDYMPSKKKIIASQDDIK